MVRNRQHDGVKHARFRLGNHLDTVFAARLLERNPGIVNLHPAAVFTQIIHDVDNAGIAQIRAVLLERQSHDQNARAIDLDTSTDHGLDQLRDDIRAHAIVQATPSKDDFGVIADALRLVRQVIGIDANAMATHQAGAKRQKIPFAARRQQHGLGVDAHPVENQGQLINQCDIQVALGVFDDFGRLGHFDAGRGMRANRDDLVIQRVNLRGNFRRRPRSHFTNRCQPMRLVARVDPLRTIADKEIPIEFQARDLFQHGHAVFFGTSRIDRRFVDDDVSRLEDRTNNFTSPQQWRQIRPLVAVNRRRHGDDKAVARAQFIDLRRKTQAFGSGKRVLRRFQRMVMAGAQFRDP